MTEVVHIDPIELKRIKRNEYQKQYWATHENCRVKHNEYMRQWRANGLDVKYTQTRLQKIECQYCHKICRRDNISHHYKTKKCSLIQAEAANNLVSPGILCE